MKESDKHASYTSGQGFFLLFSETAELVNSVQKNRQDHTSRRKPAQNLKCACMFHKTLTTQPFIKQTGQQSKDYYVSPKIPKRD